MFPSMTAPYLARALRPHLSQDGIRAVLRRARTEYRALTIAEQETWGAAWMVRLGATFLAWERALRAEGVPEARARVVEAAWASQVASVRFVGLVARLLTSDPRRRLRIIFGLMTVFPFSPPAWDERVVRDDPYGLDVDVHRCPMYAFFAAQGEPGLCKATMCDMDDRCAAVWGVLLVRTGFIATGAKTCDFRWTVPSR